MAQTDILRQAFRLKGGNQAIVQLVEPFVLASDFLRIEGGGGIASTDYLTYPINGGGIPIATGVQRCDLVVPWNCTITGWTILPDQSGSLVVDIWRSTYAQFPPVVGNSIVASAKPTLTATTKATSTTLTGWTTALAAGNILRFNVDSVTSVTYATIALAVTRSA